KPHSSRFANSNITLLSSSSSSPEPETQTDSQSQSQDQNQLSLLETITKELANPSSMVHSPLHSRLAQLSPQLSPRSPRMLQSPTVIIASPRASPSPSPSKSKSKSNSTNTNVNMYKKGTESDIQSTTDNQYLSSSTTTTTKTKKTATRTTTNKRAAKSKKQTNPASILESSDASSSTNAKKPASRTTKPRSTRGRPLSYLEASSPAPARIFGSSRSTRSTQPSKLAQPSNPPFSETDVDVAAEVGTGRTNGLDDSANQSGIVSRLGRRKRSINMPLANSKRQHTMTAETDILDSDISDLSDNSPRRLRPVINPNVNPSTNLNTNNDSQDNSATSDGITGSYKSKRIQLNRVKKALSLVINRNNSVPSDYNSAGQNRRDEYE
ncbi:hypothetical protein AX774_g8059, partial [Zancudomyces culisetae]